MANFNEAQLDFFYSFPTWYKAVWAIAVWTAFAGSVLLLVRNGFAQLMFLISIISFIVSSIYIYGFTNGMEVMGGWELRLSLLLSSCRLLASSGFRAGQKARAFLSKAH